MLSILRFHIYKVKFHNNFIKSGIDFTAFHAHSKNQTVNHSTHFKASFQVSGKASTEFFHISEIDKSSNVLLFAIFFISEYKSEINFFSSDVNHFSSYFKMKDFKKDKA